MGKNTTLAGLSMIALWLAVGCSSSTGPEPQRPSYVAPYHYLGPPSNRYYEVSLLDPPDSGRTADTLIDSTWELKEELGVLWARSYRAIRRFDKDSTGDFVKLYDSAVTSLRIGLAGDSLFIGPSPLQKILVGPLESGRSWFVNAPPDTSVRAVILGEEDLSLQIGVTRAWHVTRGAAAQDWFAPGLGRAQYQEINGDGDPIIAKLIAVGTLD